MKKWWLNGACAVLAGALAVLAVACGDDKGNGGGNSGLTEEEQYALAEQLMSAAPGLMIQSFGSQFWDGVDPEDFTFNLFGLGKLVPPRLGKLSPEALSKPVLLEADTVIFGYNSSNGWWIFHVEYSIDDDTTGISLSISLNDSVRFETQAAQGQFEPDANTYRFLHEGTVSLNVAIDADSLGFFEVGLSGDNDFTVVGLNQPQVTVNGSTNAAIDFEIDTDSVEAEIELEFTGVVDDVVTDNVPESCPDDGTISLDFAMDFTVSEGDENAQGAGDWLVTVDFLGDGMAHVEARSGDFEVASNESICEPPL